MANSKRPRVKPTSDIRLLISGALALCVLLFALCSPAVAEQPKKTPRIGYLTVGASPPFQKIIEGLRDLGYVEGQNISMIYRSADGKRDRVPALAAELVRLKVDIIVADGATPTLDARKATETIPIVMVSSSDPIGAGLVASLAQPGGNVTGLSSISGELGGKLLELLKEVAPRLSRVAIPMPLATPINELFIKETDQPARALGVQMVPIVVRGSNEFESALKGIVKQRANGIVSRLGPSFPPAQHRQLAAFAAKHHLPAISTDRDWVDSGGLIFYGPDQTVRAQRVAVYIDKILRGAKPAELPIETPMKFELVFNLKTAKQTGVTIPPNVLVRADRVIK